jgi:hypothetical protein
METNVKQLPVAQTEPKGLAIQNMDDLMRLSEFLAKSKLIPVHLQQKPADVAIILMKGHELALSPMQALDSIDVIQGKPALKPEAQLALIYKHAPQAFIQIDVDAKTNTVTVAMSRESAGKAAFRTTWDMARARQMGLDKKDNYIKQPLVMLKWRAIGEAARTVFPDVTRGLYNSYEAEDFTEPTAGEDKAKTLAAMLDEKPPEKSVEVEVHVEQRAPSKAEMTKEWDEKQAKANAAFSEAKAKIDAKVKAIAENPEPTFDDFDKPRQDSDDPEDFVINFGKTEAEGGHRGLTIRDLDDMGLKQKRDWVEKKLPKPWSQHMLDFMAASANAMAKRNDRPEVTENDVP